MSIFTVSLHRRWFGEEMETKLAEFDHAPDQAELRALATQHQLGGGATLHVKPPKGHGGGGQYRVRDLPPAAPPPAEPESGA